MISMEKTDLEDNEGNIIPTWKYRSLFLSRHLSKPILLERMVAVSNFQGNNGDVLQVSYPKTGTNWVSDMLAMLKNNNTELEMKLPEIFLEFSPDFSSMVNQKEPRSLATHLPVDMIPESLLKSAKIVLVCRNPKDVAVSYLYQIKSDKAHNYKGDWNSFFGMIVAGRVPYGCFFEYYQAWDEAVRKHPDYKVLLVYYEDFHRDSVGTLRKLCNFLEYQRTDGLLEAITAKCKFATITKEKEAHPVGKKQIEQLSNDGKHPYYRKGIVGDWKNYFTVAQSEAFDKLQEENLKGTMYNFTWEMPK